MNFLSGGGAEEPTVYGWNTKVSAPLVQSLIKSKDGVSLINSRDMVRSIEE